MRTRLTILAAIAATAALVLALSRSGPVAPVAAAPAAAVTVAADSTLAEMPAIEVRLPRDERAELYQAVLELTDRVVELETRLMRLEAELYVPRTEPAAR